ncbi:MAG: DUF1549 domain-containing protein [Gemmataceae bacterium]
MVKSSILALFITALTAWSLPAGAAGPTESLPPGAKVTRLSVYPTAVELKGPHSSVQLLVTAALEGGTSVDATRIAVIQSPTLATVSATGLVRPHTDGKGEITVSLAGQSVRIPVRVSAVKSPPSISFLNDVQPMLSKLGCSSGTCHGAQAGKNGFKLSLRSYDPIYDFRALTDDLEGRRFNRAAPDRSLILMKPAGGVPHAGGVVMQAGDSSYELLKEWISQGLRLDLNSPKVTGIEISPKNPTVNRIGDKQQFTILATYSDGSKRDVTAQSFLESSNTEVATVDKAGLSTTVRRGESTILARYEGSYAASTVVVMGDRSGFAWKAQPVLNVIDELVDKKLQSIKVQPSGLCDDATFLRRLTLDLTGLPPTSDAVRAFLDDPRPSKLKRDEMIEKLLVSPDGVDHWTNKWCDLLQVNRKFLGEPGAKALRDWVKKAVMENRPYDKMVYDIITASGANVENPPASYYKILRTPDAVMENTTQLFLAIRFNCNKCHDHPFERWTQDQYYQLAAFFAQVDRKEDPKYKGQKIGGTAVETPLPLGEIIADLKTGEVNHARTNAVVPPAFPYPDAVNPPTTLSRREQVAKWIVSPSNPYFAKSFVNRMWSYLTGVGMIEPIDDIRAGNPPTNPELLDRLTKDFIDSKFDVRQLVRTICQSRTYQLSLATNEWNKDDDVNYSHAIARRLPAEVLYDSVHAATGSKSHLPGLPSGSRAAQLIDSTVDLPGGFLDLLGKPARESACECERSNGMMLGPVLAMVSGPVIGDAVQDPTSRIAQFTAKEKDNRKVVEEIYLSVLNRRPTAAERDEGVAALEATAADHGKLMEEFNKKKAVYDAYAKTLDRKQADWEAGLKSQKPTNWTVLDTISANSKIGPNPNQSKQQSTLTILRDGSIFASGIIGDINLYTVTASAKAPGAITGLRLEALADPGLPNRGPGRAGNFVLNDFKVTAQPMSGTGDNAKPKALKLVNPEATFNQDGYPVNFSIDNNKGTGWAVYPNVGRDHAAIFRVQQGPNAKDGVQLVFTLDQRYGQSHVLGRFRLSYTTDSSVVLNSPVTPDFAKLLETPLEKRTDAQKTALRNRYLAQDAEYNRLKATIAAPPPSDPRVLGSQDLVWALLNSPAFLFNR